MSEYTHVEKPLLNQLEALGWQVVDHRELEIPGIPDDPSVSGRNSFREVILPKVFPDAVRRINMTEDGREWLADGQIAQEIGSHPGKSLVEANQAVHEMLMKHAVARNELTAEEYPAVKLLGEIGGPLGWRRRAGPPTPPTRTPALRPSSGIPGAAWRTR